MKLIVDKPAQAQLALADRGFACVLKEVLAITAPDKPGNLDKLTSALLKKKVNIKDMYGFVSPNDRQGICYMEFENPTQWISPSWSVNMSFVCCRTKNFTSYNNLAINENGYPTRDRLDCAQVCASDSGSVRQADYL
jgi:hypothetical protein